MKLGTLGVAVAGAVALLASSFLSPAQAAEDTTAPVWTKPPTNAIALGGQVNPAIPDEECGSYTVPVNISWAAKDSESGIASYGYSSYDLGPEDATMTSRNTTTGVVWVEDDACGGGGADRNIYAFNGAGGVAYWGWMATAMAVYQDNELAPGAYKPGTSYTGTWTTSACNCWSGGTTQTTKQSGASAVLRLPYDPFYDGSEYGVGLVMAKGPDRGKAAIFVDNVKVATVDTYSATKVNRTVVWRQTVPEGTQTIKVVNLATPGHPRIGFDAVVAVDKITGGELHPGQG